MKLLQLSDLIFRELRDADSAISIPSISYWLESHIGDLNSLLSLDILVEEHEFNPELTNEQATIFFKLYLLKWYDSQIRSNLGASSFDISEVSEGDTTIRRVSKNEISKTFRTSKRDIFDELNKLIGAYTRNNSLPTSYTRLCSITDDIPY